MRRRGTVSTFLSFTALPPYASVSVSRHLPSLSFSFFAHPSRLLPLPQDLSVHAAGLHLRNLVSTVQTMPRPRDSYRLPPYGSCVPDQSTLSESKCNSMRLLTVRSDLQGSGGRRLCVTIEPALLLKGDIMVSRNARLECHQQALVNPPHPVPCLPPSSR